MIDRNKGFKKKHKLDIGLLSMFSLVILACIGVSYYALVNGQWGIVPMFVVAIGVSVWVIVLTVKEQKRRIR